MCGFVGYVNKEKDKTKTIKLMNDMIIHRGPDSEGYYTDSDIALGFRRLSIIDLKGGDQPIYNEDKSMVIVFNGEIYNYRELKEDLIKKGHKFTTKSDTEVILHGYEEYNTKLFSKLRGMFSFIIYNKKTKEVVGARDYFGIKPMYYYIDKDNFMFGSEIKSFLPNKNFKKEVNTKNLKMYLIFQYSIGSDTFFKNTYKLLPGHYFKYKEGKIEIEKYYDILYDKQEDSYDKMKDTLEEVIAESVKYHKISDVEVGSYLSGGVDSSYVVSVAKPDKSFTVGFNNKGFDETVYAKELSDMLGIKNYSTHIGSDEFFDILPEIEYHTDEPHANLSTVPLYFLSKEASKQVKVVLSGEGADEMFGGYNEYIEPGIAKAYLCLPSFIRKFNANVANKLPYFKGKHFINKYSKEFCERYIGHAFVMDEDEANEILNDKLKDNTKIKDYIYPYYEKVKNMDDVTKKMYIDMNFWLPNDILLKADKMSMANSLELRVPFLDKEVFEYARKIPTKYLIKDKQTKYIFRDLANKNIPNDWAKRRKLGFPVPFSIWIREEKYYNKVKSMFNENFVSKFFDKDVINKLLEDHYNNKMNNGRKIYNIYIFLIWYKKYFVELK